MAHDDMLINQDWGFDLAGIKPRIDIWHGDADVNVPVHAATYLREIIPHTRLTILPGAGHFCLFDRWQDVLATLVSE
ncbi:MAG: alpha/beta hydrolase [Anaerolineae bacterium]|nr:alpha/beta hydrolase [Anaerolineae bacterium]